MSDQLDRFGAEMARSVFAKRGNHSEAHLRERELASLLAIAAEKAPRKVRVIHESDPKIPIEISAYIHCGQCLAEWKADPAINTTQSPADYARMQAGLTKTGIQIVCTRHNVNVSHMTLTAVVDPSPAATEKRRAAFQTDVEQQRPKWPKASS